MSKVKKTDEARRVKKSEAPAKAKKHTVRGVGRKAQNLAYKNSNRRGSNFLARCVRVLKREKFMNRSAARALEKSGVKFAHSPTHEERGPYVPKDLATRELATRLRKYVNDVAIKRWGESL